MAEESRPGTVAAAMIRAPKVHGPDATVADLLDFFTDDHVHAAAVVDDRTLLSVVVRSDLTGRAPGGPASTAGRLTGRTVSPDANLQRTRRRMLAAGTRRLAVVDGADQLMGLLCLKRTGLGFCTDADVADRARERSDGRAALATSRPPR